MIVERRNISALKAIRKGPLWVEQPSPERIKRLTELGVVKLKKNGTPYLSLRGHFTVWRAKYKKSSS
jgi:hypothetical protein